MLRPIRIAVFVCTLAGAFAFSFACDGGNGSDDPAPTVTSTVEPTSTTPSPLGLDSFHYKVALEIVAGEPGAVDDEAVISGTVEGDFVAPASHAWESMFGQGLIGGSEAFVIIGDDAWWREGTDDWTATSASDPAVASSLELTSADPGFLSDLDFVDSLTGLEGEPDDVNGVSAVRYDLSESIDQFVELFGSDFFSGDAEGFQDLDMVLWVEEDTRTLVRADLAVVADPTLLQGAPFNISPDAMLSVRMTIDISQLNDPAIEIEPPI